jgi:hypothetical protein
MPDPASLKPIATGKLARFEASARLASDLSGPLALAASGTFDARSAGEYRMICRGKDVRLTLDGKDVAIQKDGLAPVILTVGSHAIAVLQYANDGNVGVVLTMDKAPPDPAADARRFTNEYIHQWMPPLAK